MGSLTGTVTYSDGTPVPNVPIVLNNGLGQSTTTDADGHYFFMLPVASYTVTEQEPNHGYLSDTTTVTADHTAVVDFMLDILPGSLSGTVTDQDGLPLAGVQIFAYDKSSISSMQYTATTDAAGQYAFASVPPASYSVTASHTSYAAQTHAGVVYTNQNTVVDFQLPNNPGLLEGTITSRETGAPLAGATVVVGPDGIRLTTDANGHYSIMLVEGDYSVTASYPDYNAETGNGSVVTRQTTTINLALGVITSTGGGNGGGGANVAAVGGAPQTSDDSHLALYYIIAAISPMVLFAGLLILRRGKQHSKIEVEVSQ